MGRLEKLKDDRIQALSDRIDALCQPVYQEVVAEVIFLVSPDPRQLWEQQREQEFREHQQLQSGSPSRDRVALDASDARVQSVASVTTLLNSSASPPVTPTLGYNPGSEARTQTGTKEPSKEKPTVQSPESPTNSSYSPVQERGRSGGAYKAPRRSSKAGENLARTE